MPGNPALRRRGFESAARGNKITRLKDLEQATANVQVAPPVTAGGAATQESSAAAAASSAASASTSASTATTAQAAAEAARDAILARMFTGTGSPESVVTAPPGRFYLNDSGGTGTTFYVKETGTGNTGWVAK